MMGMHRLCRHAFIDIDMNRNKPRRYLVTKLVALCWTQLPIKMEDKLVKAVISVSLGLVPDTAPSDIMPFTWAT